MRLKRFLFPAMLVASLCMPSQLVFAGYEQEVLADKPFVYYRLDETSGPTANDSSGNNHHGEYVDVEYGEASGGSGLGTAIRFDGESSLIEVPALEFESDQLTIETWLNVDEIIGRCCTSVFSPNGWEPGWLHYNLGTPGRVEFALNSGGPNDRWTFDDTLELEEWVHVVSTYDADEALARVFFNGVEDEYDIPTFNSPQTVQLIVEAQIGAWQNTRYLNGAIDEFAIYDTVLSPERILAHYNARDAAGAPGDFDNSGALDVADVNLLGQQVGSGANDAAFDLTGDGNVNGDDLTNWVKDLKNTWFGDSNLDGEFNSSDFVEVFTAGKFELNEDATWSQGDWNGDNRFNSSDFVEAFTDGGFEQGPRPAQTVPEPTGALLTVVASVGLLYRKRST